MAESQEPDTFFSPVPELDRLEPDSISKYKSPEVQPGDPQYRLLETPHSETFITTDDPRIEEELSALFPLGEDACEFTVETAVATVYPEEHGEAAEVAAEVAAAAAVEKRIVILCDDHAEMLEDEITVGEGITVQMLNAAEPGQGNYLGNDGAKDFVELYDELKGMVPEEVLLEQLQRFGRKKKDNFLDLLKKKGQAHFVDPGYTRFPGWEILYNVKRMPNRAFQRDTAITYGLYVLDVISSTEVEGFSIEEGKRNPWDVADGEKVNLSQMMIDLTEAGFTHITFINMTCADFDEDLSDRTARYLARKAKVMRQLYSTQLISTSPVFTKLTGTMPMRDQLRSMIQAKAAAEEETRQKVLRKMRIEAGRENREAQKEKRATRLEHFMHLSGMDEINAAYSKSIEAAAGEGAASKGAASEGGRTRKKKYTKKQKKHKKKSTRKHKKYRR